MCQAHLIMGTRQGMERADLTPRRDPQRSISSEGWSLRDGGEHPDTLWPVDFAGGIMPAGVSVGARGGKGTRQGGSCGHAMPAGCPDPNYCWNPASPAPFLAQEGSKNFLENMKCS